MTDPVPAETARPHPGRQALIWILKILVSGGLLYWLFSKVDAAEVWRIVRTASVGWLAVSLVFYLLSVLVSAWRWGLLLGAQGIPVPFRALVNSFLVAFFFNNFLPSNIGGDVIRIRDTAKAAGSKTLATTVVLLDRGIGLLGLVFIAALGATIAADRSEAIGPIGPSLLWAGFGVGVTVTVAAVMLPHGVGFLLGPLRALHQEWVGERIERLTSALHRFRAAPRALLGTFAGAMAVQGLLVCFYAAVAHALVIPVPTAHLAILIPLSFIVQMLPVSVNGFGIRESMFTTYFKALHIPAASALALSLTSAALTMLFSTTGAVAYITRKGKTE
jgi:uncharacterized protein (TIRG00374 family)